eukprot:TRINITY_DN61639_c0_g1_i1.p1 TRINITY_DN61639_c0_g1~~TRINITY_DN61639_c0_g1_i1.p1  ORF type:complete len:256 (-),score=53.89 TRINITY_DN61639_c0_g1_i1:80-847(-)
MLAMARSTSLPAVPPISPTRQRSVALGVDPAMKEMVHFVGSHEHDARLKCAADLRKGINDQVPEAFREEIETLRQAEAAEDHRPLPVQSTALVDARLEWRDKMDRQMRRLLQDTNLAMDDRVSDKHKHDMRCNHTDKMYDFFSKNGMKQARKERLGPDHVRFDPNAPVMAGSMRKEKIVSAALLLPPSMPVKTDGSPSSSRTSLVSAGTQALRPTLLLSPAPAMKESTMTRKSSRLTMTSFAESLSTTQAGRWNL